MERDEIIEGICKILECGPDSVHPSPTEIVIRSEETITIQQLQAIADLLGTERIDIVPSVYTPGYSDVTPSSFSEGSINVYPKEVGDTFYWEPPRPAYRWERVPECKVEFSPRYEPPDKPLLQEHYDLAESILKGI